MGDSVVVKMMLVTSFVQVQREGKRIKEKQKHICWRRVASNNFVVVK